MVRQLHQRRRAPVPLTSSSLEMSDLNHSREPLLSPNGSAAASNDDNSDGEGSNRSYGSTSVKNDRDFYSSNDSDDPEHSKPSHSRHDENKEGIHDGVQRADAMTLVWTKSTLIAAYSFIFLCSFANALQYQVMNNLMPFVVSEFSAHSLIPTIGIVASVMSGILKLPIARMIDAWGRPQGLAAMVTMATVGLVLMALSPNVKAYAAAEVIYQVGISGFTYVLEIVVADTSSLKNRTLAFAFNSSPHIVTTFIGPPVAMWFYEHSNWRWAFAVSSIVFFVLSIPIFSILTINTHKARKRGLLPPPPSKEASATARSIKQFLRDHDALGIVLINASLTLILVPFSLVGLNSTSTADGESHTLSGSNLILIIIGLVLLAIFAYHERYRAPHPLINFSLLLSPNVAGACLLAVCVFVAYFSWDGYYTSYLQVVHDLDITTAGYIGHIYGVGCSVWAAVVGYLIRKTDRYKWLAWAALPVHIAGGALMVFFRRPDTEIVWVIMCQVLITIGGSTLVVVDQMAVMAVANHAELASVMALLSLATYIGSAVGSALSGAIWNTTLPNALGALLPELSGQELEMLGSDLRKQLEYPMGHPVREAIVAAYGTAQTRMCVAGTLVSCLSIVAVFMFKDARVSKSRQVKGTVL